MPQLIKEPTLIPVPGGKNILEFIGKVNSNDEKISVAVMHAPAGWSEPAQTPEFDEYTLVLSGTLEVEHEGGSTIVSANQAIVTRAGERVRYLTKEDAHYIAICLPAFSIDLVNREDD